MNLKRSLVLFLLLTCIFPTAGGELKSIKVLLNTTISGADILSDVYDFPVLIKLNAQNFNFDESDGTDLKFISSESENICHFIERFDPVTKVAEIFVKMPIIYANDNTQYIKMLYGDPSQPGVSCESSDIFDNNYASVWLMDTAPIQGCTDAIKDRTQNDNHGTAYNMSSSKLVDGKVGKAIRFDGYNDYIWMGMAPSINQLQNNFTVSCWMKTETLCGYHKMFSASKYYNDGFGFGIKNNRLYYAAYDRQGYVNYNFTLQCNKWYYVAATIDQYNNVHFYVDGEEIGSIYGYYTPLANTSTFFIGATTETNTSDVEQLWKGTLDQISISTTSRSADWLKLEYENQKANQQFAMVEKDNEFKVMPNISYFSMFAREDINIGNQVEIYGDIGTNDNGSIYVGESSYLKSDIYCGSNVSLNDGAKVIGDVTATQNITTHLDAIITGFRRDETPVLNYSIPLVFHVEEWLRGIIINDDETVRISPENYWAVDAYNGSTLILEAGTYNFQRFSFHGNDAKILFDIDKNDEVEIYVWDEMEFGQNFKMQFTGTRNPRSIKINFDIDGAPILHLKENSEFNCIFTLPDGDVTISQGTKLYGSIYARNINVEQDVLICKPPFLDDFTHSEWAYGPPFDPDVIKYNAVVPENTSSLLVTPTLHNPNINVTVNGQSPNIPVNLDQNPKIITIELLGGDKDLGSIYTLTVTKDPIYMIHVDDNAGPLGDGTSWDKAYNFLPWAIYNARKQGKEIWVAEGLYRNEQDGSNDPFELYPGIELIGSFIGNETSREPKGSIYNTILTGDYYLDDGSASWPPTFDDIETYLDDNAQHTIFIWGGKDAISTRIFGLTINRGIAYEFFDNEDEATLPEFSLVPDNYFTTGIYYESQYEPLIHQSNGGGIYISHSSPTIERCIIASNYSHVDGAGMYSRAGPKLLKNCLFEDNYTPQGWGGGEYTKFNKRGVIDGCIFDGNKVGDFELYSGAIYTELSDLNIVNSIFTRNVGGAAGGAIYNRQGNLKLINCTITGNRSTHGSGAITNYDNASTDILNTIIWNNIGESVLQGEGFTANYSCIQGGFPIGNGNIDVNPQFEVAGSPKGADEQYGNQDDGLIIGGSSPCIDAGTESNAPDFDLRYFPRPTYENVDIGAYEYYQTAGSVKFGHYTSNGFTLTTLKNVSNVIDEMHVNRAVLAHQSVVLEIEVAGNSKTNSKDVITSSVYCINSSGDNISGTKIGITLYRVPGTNFFRTKLFDGSVVTGKDILISISSYVANQEFQFAYVLLGALDCDVKVEIPHSQFD